MKVALQFRTIWVVSIIWEAITHGFPPRYNLSIFPALSPFWSTLAYLIKNRSCRSVISKAVITHDKIKTTRTLKGSLLLTLEPDYSWFGKTGARTPIKITGLAAHTARSIRVASFRLTSREGRKKSIKLYTSTLNGIIIFLCTRNNRVHHLSWVLLQCQRLHCCEMISVV